MSIILFILSAIVLFYAAWKQAKINLHHERVIFDSVFIVSVAALIGARLGYIFLHFQDFSFHILRWIVVFVYPGLSLSGALLGLGLGFWILSERKTLVPFKESVDVITTAILIALPFILIGFIGGGSLHPTTFYKLGAVLMLPILVFILKKRIRFEAGILALFILIFFSVAFFSIDFFKPNDIVYWNLSIDQWTTLLIFFICIGTLSMYYRIKRGTR